ncbi:MAG: D-alanyl-D-alanine carboxypeptidase family protein, partial [Candidatus Saccharimonadales bacterium]|nr:D-alanyl-D-alanine carboxypeptidase family protein [Candidatus Saccharimonadales bacterium]
VDGGNIDFGLYFKYPNNWGSLTSGLSQVYTGPNDEGSLAVFVEPINDAESIQEWLNRSGEADESSLNEVQIANAQSAYFIRQNETEDQVTQTVYIKQGSRIFSLVIFGPITVVEDIKATIQIDPNTNPSEPESQSRLLELTDVAFRELYNSLNLSDAERISEPPSITGSQGADDHIRMVAEARGYRLQFDATAELGSADGYPLQQVAADAWAELQTAAAQDGIPLNVTSGFRSVDSQRQIFLARLQAACAEIYGTGCSDEQIAGSQADQALDEVLATSSIPGYSRHHSGHTVDIGHTGVGEFEDFFGTPGWDWISADNYKNAKRFGFIPSYPPNGGLQGPDPEPWEYVYIGGPEFFLIGE